jgi:hypothetical protein
LLDRAAIVDRLLGDFTRSRAGARLRAHARACRAPITPAAASLHSPVTTDKSRQAGPPSS